MKEYKLSLLTIGHSNLSINYFLGLLGSREVEIVADVRSRPQSRFSPQFNRVSLNAALSHAGIEYLFMGAALGGRPSDPSLLRDGNPDYARMAKAPDFLHSVAKLIDLARKRRVALLCSEHEPLECHRCILIGRHLVSRGVLVAHILRDGSTEDHGQAEDRLIAYHDGMRAHDLLAPRATRLAEAYRRQSQHMKFRPPKRMR